MLVFIDESGCSGFKLTRGSDAVFAIGMVIFDDRESARRTERSIEQYRVHTGHRDEIKFSRSSNRARDDFFAAVSGCPFRIRALVVEKERVENALLRVDHEAFYSFFIGQLARRAAGSLKDVKLSVDGSGSAHFQRGLKRNLRRELRTLRDLRLVDSRRDSLVQLADMCVGAVARAFRSNGEGARWLQILAPHVEDISQFR